MDPFWAAHDAMMDRIKDERPADADALFAILNTVTITPHSGDAFALEGDKLMTALEDAGWSLAGIEADYLWEARSPSGEWINYCEGDLYRGRRQR